MAGKRAEGSDDRSIGEKVDDEALELKIRAAFKLDKTLADGGFEVKVLRRADPAFLVDRDPCPEEAGSRGRALRRGRREGRGPLALVARAVFGSFGSGVERLDVQENSAEEVERALDRGIRHRARLERGLVGRLGGGGRCRGGGWLRSRAASRRSGALKALASGVPCRRPPRPPRPSGPRGAFVRMPCAHCPRGSHAPTPETPSAPRRLRYESRRPPPTRWRRRVPREASGRRWLHATDRSPNGNRSLSPQERAARLWRRAAARGREAPHSAASGAGREKEEADRSWRKGSRPLGRDLDDPRRLAKELLHPAHQIREAHEPSKLRRLEERHLETQARIGVDGLAEIELGSRQRIDEAKQVFLGDRGHELSGRGPSSGSRSTPSLPGEIFRISRSRQ